jgi:hypothetical protein
MFGLKRKKNKTKNEDTPLEELVKRLGEGLKQDIVETVVIEADKKMTAVLNAEDSVTKLTKEKTGLETDIAKLKSQKKIDETEIKTIIKVAEEKAALELERKELELMKVHLANQTTLVEKYHTDLAAAVNKEREKMEGFMKDVMDKFQGRDIQVIK